MRKKDTVVLVAILVLSLFFIVPLALIGASAVVVYVPDEYVTIQEAINAVSEGDTIIVRDGIYNVNLNVNKSLTIRSENGSANCIVKALNPDDHVFELTKDYVNISGFTVEDATGSWNAGIYLGDFVDHCTISNNVVLHNRYGILPWYATDNIITGNTISDNYCGINLYSANSNTITNNVLERDGLLIMGWQLSHYNTHVIENNTVNGKPLYYYKNAHGLTVPDDAGEVILANCSDMLVEQIQASFGTVGIELSFTTDSNLLENVMGSNSYYGIYLAYSSNNTISDNNVTDSYSGIALHSSSTYNTVANNTVTENNYSGIYLYSSDNNVVTANTADSNNYGILSWSSNNNHIYHNNLVNNTDHASDNTGTNTWDAEFPAGGNYWSDYSAKYPGAAELNESGIWDMPYDIAGGANAQDRYPLVTRYGMEELLAPIISNISITNITTNSATISWETNEPANSLVKYGLESGNYTLDQYESANVTAHRINLTGLHQNTTYYFVVNSTDLDGKSNESVERSFATLSLYATTEVGVTTNITTASPEDLAAYLPPEYAQMDLSDAIVLNVNVMDATPNDPTDDAYMDITLLVQEFDVATCKVFKAGTGFLPEVEDVRTRPTVDADPAFSRNLTANTVTIRLYVGDPLLAVFPVAGSVTSRRGGGSGASRDSDGDGLANVQELLLGTDEDNPDTDGDGFKDGEDPFPFDPKLPLQSTPTPTPSHAMVPQPTPTPVIVPTPSLTAPGIPEEQEAKSEPRIPGFGALAALGGLCVVFYLTVRRRC